MDIFPEEESMLSGAGLAQELWAEAVDTAKYLLNMSPSVDASRHNST
jgi:hypothetical protein